MVRQALLGEAEGLTANGLVYLISTEWAWGLSPFFRGREKEPVGASAYWSDLA